MAENVTYAEAKEYLNTAEKFVFKDFFIFAMGNMSYREASKCLGVNNHMICKIRGIDPYTPSLATCRRIAKACGVDDKLLWLRVCEEVYETREDFILQR